MNPIDNEEVQMQTHAEWARDDTDRRRLEEYANPTTGSDRFFAEANRLDAQGFPVEAEVARQTGVARYEEIKSRHPWPQYEVL